MTKKTLALILLSCTFSAAPLAADPPAPLDAGRRRVALEKLRVLGSVLYVGAHPDDENTALLAYLAGERKVRAAYLALTRGDGGQNLIGTEQGGALGVIRTEELLAARAIDGAEQIFTRAVDFGYSKTAAESLRIWDRDKVLADVVWAIRSFRPDVVITRFPATGNGGHGHHTASAILARDAFDAAGDPARFPEQLAYLTPWRPKRLVWNTFRPPGTAATGDTTAMVTLDLGVYNPALGLSYTEIAGRSRSMHKSQGFGAAERRGPNVNRFEHLAGEAATQDLFDGIDLTWRRVPGGERVDGLLAQAIAAATETQPEAAAPHLIAALAAVDALPRDPWAARKREEILAALRSATGLWLEATVVQERLTTSDSFKVTLAAVNRSATPLTLERVEVTGAEPKVLGATLANNAPVTAELTATLPADTAPSQAYWLDEVPANGTYVVHDQRLIGRPRNPATLMARFLLSAGGQSLEYVVPVEYRFTDPVEGDVYRAPVLTPDVTVDVASPLLVFPDAQPHTLRLRVHAQREAAQGTLRLVVPQGFRVTPERLDFALAKKDEEATLEATLTPTAPAAVGALEVRLGDGRPARALSVISHAHIPQQTLLPRVQVHLVRVDLVRPVRRVGYVMGAGDEIPAVLRQIGLAVTLLNDEDLATGELGGYEAIVIGVRAYNTRDVLRTAQPRLLRYAEAGGTLIVQYNTERGLVTDEIGPFGLKLSRERVADERAAVRLLAPDHPLLTTPHRIQASDFDGWIQERGLYFPVTWDERYTALLGMHDEGEPDRNGALLVVPYGKGRYIQTGLAFFRQLPAGVPGALRLFVNLLAAGRSR